MGIFSRLFARGPRKPTATEQVNAILERFTGATILAVDREDIGRYPAKQYKVMAFHFGAIEYLAGRYGLDETQTLAILVAFINRYFNMPVTETGSISERVQGFRENAEESRYLAAGHAALRRWHEQDDRRAALQLGAMLKEE